MFFCVEILPLAGDPALYAMSVATKSSVEVNSGNGSYDAFTETVVLTILYGSKLAHSLHVDFVKLFLESARTAFAGKLGISTF